MERNSKNQNNLLEATNLDQSHENLTSVNTSTNSISLVRAKTREENRVRKVSFAGEFGGVPMPSASKVR